MLISCGNKHSYKICLDIVFMSRLTNAVATEKFHIESNKFNVAGNRASGKNAYKLVIKLQILK